MYIYGMDSKDENEIWLEDKTEKESLTKKEGWILDSILMFIVAPILYFIWKGISLLLHL